QYYYEMDLHVDLDISQEFAHGLLDARTGYDDPQPRRRWWRKRRSGAQPAVAATSFSQQPATPPAEQAAYAPLLANAIYRFAKARRNSYRAERNLEDETLHKIYIDRDLLLTRPPWWLWFLTRKLHLVLVYEIMFHRPAQAPTYIFQDLRVVATTSRILTPAQIRRLKLSIIAQFVNPLLRSDLQFNLVDAPHKEFGKREFADSLLSLNEVGTGRTPPGPAVCTFNWLARQWPVPLAVFGLGLVLRLVAFFGAHPHHAMADLATPAAARHIFFLDTVTALSGGYLLGFVLLLIVLIALVTIGWFVVRSAYDEMRRDASAQKALTPQQLDAPVEPVLDVGAAAAGASGLEVAAQLAAGASPTAQPSSVDAWDVVEWPHWFFIVLGLAASPGAALVVISFIVWIIALFG
ncbi:MAG: hypothetical protein ACHQ4H_16640, partial [Ktedonobacterales bacterium]